MMLMMRLMMIIQLVGLVLLDDVKVPADAHYTEFAVRNGDLIPLPLSFCVCSKWAAILLGGRVRGRVQGLGFRV